jgi:hypothetical protein
MGFKLFRSCQDVQDDEQPIRNKKKVINDPSETDMVIIRLKDLRDQLLAKQKQLNISIEKADLEIREKLKKGNKEQAKFALKRKKLFENFLQISTDKYLWTQKAILDVETQVLDQHLNEIIKNTNSLLKKMQEGIDLEVFDELKEGYQKNKEISEKFDEIYQNAMPQEKKEEIEYEYNKYEAEILKDQLQNVPEAEIKREEKKEKESEGERKVRDMMEERLMELA